MYEKVPNNEILDVWYYTPVVLAPNQYAEQSEYLFLCHIRPFPHCLALDMHQECQSGYSCLISLISEQLRVEMRMHNSFLDKFLDSMESTIRICV